MVLIPARHLLSAALLMVLAACGTGQELNPRPTPEPAVGSDPAMARFAPWSSAAPGYRIGEGDKLRIQFPRTPEMDQDVLVRPDGVVTLKAAGDVEIADLQPAEASRLIAEKATKKLRDPDVMIEVLDPVSARIYIGGEVKAPGAYRVGGPMTTIAALQLAAGASDTGRIDSVVLIRRAPDGRPMLRLVDVRGLLEGRSVEDPRIISGDILFVPRTRIAEVGLWVEQFINRVVPFQRSFSYTLGRTSNTTN